MEGFEEFDQYHSRSIKELLITIQRRGTFSLNRAAYRALGSPDTVNLLFNRIKRQIAFRPSTSAGPRNIPLRRMGTSETFVMAGLTFCKEFDIDTTVARRYTGKIQENVLIVDLNEPSTIATGPRMRNDVSDKLQGKQERRWARRIAERTSIPDNGEDILKVTVIQAHQNATINSQILLKQEERNILENGLQNGTLSLQDILNFLEEKAKNTPA